jgi:hypothetical protein
MVFLARRMAGLSFGAVAASLVASGALAGESSTPTQPAGTANSARCSAMGEGFFAVSGSDACIRISSYVAAGAEFGGLRPAWRNSGPFDGASTTALRTRVGASADARFDTPMGPGRLYIQVGHDPYRP